MCIDHHPTRPIVVTEILRTALKLYRTAFLSVVARTLPLIAIAEAIAIPCVPDTSPSICVLPMALSWLLSAWACARALRVMFRTQQPIVSTPIGTAPFLSFVLVSAYIDLTTMLAMLLLLVPALLVAAATIFAPLFALEHNQGPIEAVASSAKLAQDNIFPIALVVLAFSVIVIVASSSAFFATQATGVLASVLEYAFSVVCVFVTFYYYAIAIVLFERLNSNTPNASVIPTDTIQPNGQSPCR